MTSVEAEVTAIQTIAAIPSILDIVCKTTGMGFAAVARVTEDRWIACEVLDHVNFGLLPGAELPIKTTLCDEVRSSRQEIVIDDVANDPVYAEHDTPRLYSLQSYISVPIVLRDGSFFGTLCAIDAKPRPLKQSLIVDMFRLFAQLIAHQIDSHRAVEQKSAQLAETRETSDLREQFIAILGHDLRNPLAAVQGGTRILMHEPQSEKSLRVLDAMQESIQRMTGLVSDMLDLARGRLAGGITVEPNETRALTETLENVVRETRIAYPQRDIWTNIKLERNVPVDHRRVAQLLSNLLTNAIAHGDQTPIRVDSSIRGDNLQLSVANRGVKIPPEAVKRLFQPFYRGHKTGKSEGLGLGLYIASEIAMAHGGTLDVQSDDSETVFTFRMPLTKSLPR